MNEEEVVTYKNKAATSIKKKMTMKKNIQSETKDLGTEGIICEEIFKEDCVRIDPSKPCQYCNVCKAKNCLLIISINVWIYPPKNTCQKFKTDYRNI